MGEGKCKRVVGGEHSSEEGQCSVVVFSAAKGESQGKGRNAGRKREESGADLAKTEESVLSNVIEQPPFK